MFKRNARKFLSLALALAFAISLIPSMMASVTPVAPDFEQISEWARPHIQKLFDHGIMSGDEHGNVLPNLTSHRWEAAILTVKAFGFDALDFEDQITDNFTDVQITDPYVEDYINKAVALSVMGGDGDGQLLLGRQLTRVEMFGLVANALQLADAPEEFDSQFEDIDEIAQWERGIILKLEAAGFISGDGSGNVNPHQLTNREQMFALFSNVLGELIDEDTDYDGASYSHATIRKAGVHVQNLTVGTLRITQGVGDGEVILEDCAVDTLIVHGEPDSVRIIDATEEDATEAAFGLNEGLEAETDAASETEQSYTVTGEVTYEDNVFPDEVAEDFIDQMDGDEGEYRPSEDIFGSQFTYLSIENFVALLTQAGIEDGDVYTIVQSNPALEIYEADENIAYDDEADVWLKVKQYTHDEEDTAAFNFLLLDGESVVTIKVYASECTVGDASSVDEEDLVLTLTFVVDITVGAMFI